MPHRQTPTLATALAALFAAAAIAKSAPVDPLMLEAQSLLADRQVLDIARRAEAALEPLLDDLKRADPDQIVRLTTLRQFGVLFDRVGRVEGPERETLAWLLSGRRTDRLFKTLMLGIGPADSPDSFLGVVSRIRQDHRDKPADFAELTTALAVVYDAAEDMSGETARPPDPVAASRLFAFYTNARSSLQIDPVALPWQLGVFVVHNQVTEADLAWAISRFAGRQKLRDLYFDVPNVEDGRVNPPAQRRGAPAQTRLQQLAANGGSTQDRALYAVSIARALGVPATTLYDSGEDGRIRAWVAVLELRDGVLFFDTNPSAFEEFKGLSGQTLDPQTHRVISEGELGLLVEFRDIPEEDRLASLAMVRLATAERAGQRGQYLVRLPTGEPDHAKRLDLLLRAIDLAPANRDAWAALRALGRAGQMDEVSLDQVLAAIERRLAPRFPGFALDVMVDAMSWRGTREQLATLDKARGMFRNSPPTLMRLQLVRGDLLADAGRTRQALAAYATLLDAANDAGQLAVQAMERVDRMLRESGDLAALVSTYQRVWTRMPIPRAAGVTESTAWFRIGTAYASVLEETGQTTAASQVLQRLSVLMNETDVRRGSRSRR